MTESPEKPRALSELIRRRTNELVTEAQSANGTVDAERLSNLERLSRLHDLETSLDEPRRYRLWSGLALFSAIVLVVLLYESRLNTTAISAEMLVREVAMEVGTEQAVIPGRGLSYLSFTGLDSVRLPSGDDQFEVIRATTAGLLVDTSTANPSTLDLDEWSFPAGTSFRVLATDVNGTYGWIVEYPESSKQIQMSATVSGTIFANIDGRLHPLATEFGAPVEYYASSALHVTAAYPDSATRVLSPIPVARMLAFDQRLRYQEQYRELSSVLTGSVTLEDLGAREIKFGPGQSLRFTRSQVEVPHLAFERSGIRVRFSGEVGGMSTGAARHRNLMPRILQLLASSPALLLIGSAILTVFGYLLGLRRWLSPKR